MTKTKRTKTKRIVCTFLLVSIGSVAAPVGADNVPVDITTTIGNMSDLGTLLTIPEWIDYLNDEHEVLTINCQNYEEIVRQGIETLTNFGIAMFDLERREYYSSAAFHFAMATTKLTNLKDLLRQAEQEIAAGQAAANDEEAIPHLTEADRLLQRADEVFECASDHVDSGYNDLHCVVYGCPEQDLEDNEF